MASAVVPTVVYITYSSSRYENPIFSSQNARLKKVQQRCEQFVWAGKTQGVSIQYKRILRAIPTSQLF